MGSPSRETTPLSRAPAPGGGQLTTGNDRTIEIPKEFGAGHYEVHLGLFDPKTGTRYGLDADESGQRSYLMGHLVAEGSDGNVTNITFQPRPTAARPAPRQNTAQIPIDFGPVKTIGAVRCEWNPDHIVLTPLPGEPAFTIALDTSAILKIANLKVESVRARDDQGNVMREISTTMAGSTITFVTDPRAFDFEISLRDEEHTTH